MMSRVKPAGKIAFELEHLVTERSNGRNDPTEVVDHASHVLTGHQLLLGEVAREDVVLLEGSRPVPTHVPGGEVGVACDELAGDWVASHGGDTEEGRVSAEDEAEEGIAHVPALLAGQATSKSQELTCATSMHSEPLKTRS